MPVPSPHTQRHLTYPDFLPTLTQHRLAGTLLTTASIGTTQPSAVTIHACTRIHSLDAVLPTDDAAGEVCLERKARGVAQGTCVGFGRKFGMSQRVVDDSKGCAMREEMNGCM